MKKLFILIIALLFTGAISAQKQVTDFESIMDAMKSGNTVKAVFHYADCQQISNNEIQEKSPDAIGGMALKTWEYFAPMVFGNKNAFVVASKNKFIQNPIGDGFVYNYVKVKISDDNKVKITAKYLDAKSHEEIMTENFFTSINNGEEDSGAAYFYTNQK